MMKRLFAALLLIVADAQLLIAANWYASPNADSTGDGSFQKPWPLQAALTQTLTIKPGDTLYLRGGIYKGPGFMSTISGIPDHYITVRSFPAEWAVITDGQTPVLLSDLNDSSTNAWNVAISGSSLWGVGMNLTIGTEMIRLIARQNVTNWYVVRGWGGTTVTSHSSGSPANLRMDFITHSGSNVIFRDFEITAKAAANRITGSTNYLGCGLNLLAPGGGNKAVNLVVDNVGHPAIGFWNQGDGGEINGCLIWGNGIYDNEGAWIRGSGVYGQNSTGNVLLKNNIVFRNFTCGMKGFGETGPVMGFHFNNNIVFAQPEKTLEISSGSSRTVGNWMDGNVMLGTPLLSYQSKSNSFQYFINNTVVNGTFTTTEHYDSVYTNNLVFMPRNATGNSGETVMYLSTYFAKSALNIVWDYNTYYLGDNSPAYSWGFRTADASAVNSLGGGGLKFANDAGKAWQDWSGFDSHSTYKYGWPTSYLNVRAQRLDYDPNKWHVVVVSTSGQVSATLNLGSLGFGLNDQYELRDAQNYFAVVAFGRYSGGSITLPLNLTNVSTIRGTLTHYTNEHTNVKYPGLFNAFVLRRVTTPAPPSNVRILSASGG